MRKPAILQREYLFTDKELMSLLSLDGEKIIKISIEYGIWSIFTKESVKDAD